MSHLKQPKHPVKTIRLRPGLEARELEEALLFSNRACDTSRRALAFYLDDMQRRGIHQALGFSSTTHFAYQRLGMSRRQARDFVMVGKALRELTVIDGAFCQGRLSWTKVRLLVPIATVANESVWLARAESISCHILEAEVRGAEKGRPPREDGKGTPSVKFHFGASLAPTAHEVFLQARRKICAEAGAELDDGEVLLALAERYLRPQVSKGESPGTGDSLYQVSISQCSTCAESHVNTDDGPIEISEEELGVIRCDAEVLGSSKAPATSKALRRRVLARDGKRCTNCASTLNLHAHHIVFRNAGGPTRASNLTTLCARCHGMVHDGFLIVSGRAPHDLAIVDRDGYLVNGLQKSSGARITMGIQTSGAQAPLASPIATGPKLSEIIGQEHVIDCLSVACRAAAIETRPMRHALLCGPPGLGKTTVARAVAIESGVPFVERLGPAVTSIDDLFVEPGSLLFVDEIHGLPRSVAEILYDTMDQKRICVMGATTNPDLMPKPLRDRFLLQAEFLPYSKEELMSVVEQATSIPIDKNAAALMAQVSFGTPRRVLALLAAVEDRRLAFEHKRIDVKLVEETLNKRRVDSRGLGPRHRQALDLLARHQRPVGRMRLADTMGIDRGVFRNTIEPELLQLDLVAVTAEGLTAV